MREGLNQPNERLVGHEWCGHPNMLRIDWKVVMCAAREIKGVIWWNKLFNHECKLFTVRLFQLARTCTLSCLVFQDVLCSARMAGRSTKKPALARAMASGKARIAHVRNIIPFIAFSTFVSFTHTPNLFSKLYPRTEKYRFPPAVTLLTRCCCYLAFKYQRQIIFLVKVAVNIKVKYDERRTLTHDSRIRLCLQRKSVIKDGMGRTVKVSNV